MSYASDALIDSQERVIDAQEREIKKLESENASLKGAAQGLGELCDRYKAENEKLRDLILDMLVDEERGHNDDDTYYEHVERANELGVEFRG